jgi:hypothetical protein
MNNIVPFVFGALVVLFITFFIYRLIKTINRNSNLIKNGVRVKAKVLSIENTLINTGSKMSEPFREVTLEIQDESMKGEVITIKKRFYSTKPQEGDIIEIIVDPENINKAIISTTN